MSEISKEERMRDTPKIAYEPMPGAYVSRPTEIEAFQWTPDVSMGAMREFTNHLTRLDDVAEDFKVYDRRHDAWFPFAYGDWIIKGTRGEFYPCEDSVFRMRYKPVAGDSDE